MNQKPFAPNLLVDDLYMAYKGNMLTSVRDEASRYSYAGATDFDGVKGQEYPLTYNDAGSLISDAGRKIARIDYDYLNDPIRIQFTNGNVTKYVYSATGEKLRVIYQTAVPNITVAIGSSKELASSEIQYTDSTDYLLGGDLTLKNGRIDKFQFEEGYCQAEKYNATQDNFTFCYYDQDHLGNIRQVTKADGSTKGKIIQKMHYYPFGAQLCDGTTDSNVQSRKYNGKEYDRMHGLNTYDYGARQYNPVTARWDRVDPLAEKYYDISPYAYCAGDPVNNIDINGDSITMDNQSIIAIYNGMEKSSHLTMTFNNGILDPSSISDAASSANDTFLRDLYEIAINPQMVKIRTTETNNYYMNGDMYPESWGIPSDIDYAKNYNNGVPSDLFPAGKTIMGNLGQTLYPQNSNELKKSLDNCITININGKGSLNQRSCGLAHEFGHVVLYMRNLPHSHSGNADFIYGRQWNVMKRFDYDYLESPTGKIFRR